MSQCSTRDRRRPETAPKPPQRDAPSGWDRFAEEVDPLPDGKPPLDPERWTGNREAVREEAVAERTAPRRIGIGAGSGVNRRQASQLRRGQYPIQARIDLHGRTVAEARIEVARFLKASAGRDLRCVLVITGKGRSAQGSSGGILRKSLEQWLNAPGTRDLVLACEEAQPSHGGAGAFYVLLRRRRVGR